MRRLESDPKWVAERDRRELERQQHAMEFAVAAAPLKAELATVGFPVEGFGSTWFNFRPEHKVFIPILIKWLPRIENQNVRETIVRLLTDRMARPVAANPLIDEFKRVRGSETWVPYYKATVAAGIAVVADESSFDALVSLVSDPRHGWARGWLLPVFWRMHDPRTDDTLLKVLEGAKGEEETAVPVQGIRVLGNRGCSKAKPYIEEYLNHPEAIVRKEAAKSLEKIARAEAKARERVASRK